METVCLVKVGDEQVAEAAAAEREWLMPLVNEWLARVFRRLHHVMDILWEPAKACCVSKDLEELERRPLSTIVVSAGL